VNERAVRYEVALRTDAPASAPSSPRGFPSARGIGDLLPGSKRPCPDDAPGKGRCRCRAGEALAGTGGHRQENPLPQAAVEYGIEHFFVEEGKGRAVERARNARNLRVEVALREDGQGLITGLFLDGRRIP
jgi:hypothetical protein